MRKAALLMEKGSSAYGKVSDLYRQRCLIAHGAPAKVGAINVAADYQAICSLWKALMA
jgi:hypothetical protein